MTERGSQEPGPGSGAGGTEESGPSVRPQGPGPIGGDIAKILYRMLATSIMAPD